MIAQIKTLQSTGNFTLNQGVYKGQTLYSWYIEMDDGCCGSANTKKETPPYQVGDTVEYSITGKDKRGANKLSVKRPTQQGVAPSTPSGHAQSPYASAPEVTDNPHDRPMINGQTVGMAINNAVDALKDKLGVDLFVDDGSFAEVVHELASQLIRISYKLEHGHLAAKLSHKSLAAANEALAANGFPAVKPTGAPPATGAAYHPTPGETDDVPF